MKRNFFLLVVLLLSGCAPLAVTSTPSPIGYDLQTRIGADTPLVSKVQVTEVIQGKHVQGAEKPTSIPSPIQKSPGEVIDWVKVLQAEANWVLLEQGWNVTNVELWNIVKQSERFKFNQRLWTERAEVASSFTGEAEVQFRQVQPTRWRESGS